MRKILRIISSRKLAIVLLLLTTSFSIVGTTVIDQGQFGEYAKSWWFISVILLLLLSTAMCTAQRIKSYRYRKENLESSPKNFESKIITKKDIFKGYSALDDELKRNRYKTELKKLDLNTFSVRGIKGQFGFWGSIIFHISFLIIGFGVIFSLAFKFSGDFVLVEGNTFSDYQAGYMNVETGLLYKNNHGQYQFKFKNFEPIISNNKRVQLKDQYSEDYVSSIAIIDNYQTVKEVELGVNQKVRYKGYTINPDYYGHGYAPKLKVTAIDDKKNEFYVESDDKDYQANLNGESILESFLVLNTELHGSYDEIAEVMTRVTYSDEIELANLNWRLKVNFFPNRPKAGENTVEASAFAKSPMLSVQIHDLKDKSLIYQGVVQLKEPIKVDSYLIEFTEVKNWQRFLVRKDRGQEIVYIGFFLGIVGLILRFTQHRREIRGLVKLEDEQVVIYLKETLENKSFQKSQLDQILTAIRGNYHD